VVPADDPYRVNAICRRGLGAVLRASPDLPVVSMASRAAGACHTSTRVAGRWEY